MIPEKLKRILEKQQYRLVGNYSSVKICHWTKESLKRGRVCYKEIWYPPVESHRCMQMTPYLGCNFRCLHCWRMHPGDRNIKWREFPQDPDKFDEPKEIVEGLIEKRKKLLSGFKGLASVDKRKFEQALKPTMMTMSLTGEPAFYPNLGDLVREAKEHEMITFLVTNGSLPERLEKMHPLPWQLYVSVYGPDKRTFNKLARPRVKDAWEKLIETLELLPSLDTRKVFRMLTVNGYNMINAKGYAKLIKRSEPDFVEVKQYEWVGESRKRLKEVAVPKMKEIRKFSREVGEFSGYKIKDEFIPSGVVLLTE